MAGTKGGLLKSERTRALGGQYDLLRGIGEGSFAKVILASHIITGEEVAVKVFDKSRFTSKGVDGLYEEIRIMKKLNHPNVIKFLDVFDTHKHLFLIMEYVSGGDLFSHLTRYGRMKERQARKVFRQIVSTLEHCHQKGIIHGDIKDENLLLDKAKNIKLIDFGLSKMFVPGERIKANCGSLPYLAPEIIQGEKYGPEIDVWALGVVLYVMMTNFTPFSGRTEAELKEKILNCNFMIPHFVSSDCGNLIKKLLVVDPAMRPTLTAVMKDEWLNGGREED